MSLDGNGSTTKRILLFDRDPESIQLFSAVFDEMELSLVTIADKESGLREISEGNPDLVIADAEFPLFSAFNLLDEFLEKKLNIPVVVLSSKPEDIIRAFRSKATDLFRKPLNKAEILNRLPIILNTPGGNVSQLSSEERKRLERLERENKEMNDLLKISFSIDVSGDSKQLLERLTNLAAETMNCEAASIMLKNDRENVLEFVVATGEKSGRIETLKIPIGEGIAGWVAQYGKPQIVNDTSNDDRFTGMVDKESGFETKQILAMPMFVEDDIIGVLEVINSKDDRQMSDNDVRILGDVCNRAALVIGTTKKIENQQNFYIQVTNIIVKAIEKKEMHGEGHSWKVAELCHKIGSESKLSENEMDDLYFAALLHDIGKLEIPGVLLNKRNLSEREKDFLRQHTVKGAKLIEQILLWKNAVPGILYHHENWDGSGYPFGRSGDSIPLIARIINVAESFTVMRSPNSYKRQMTLKESILEVMRGAGKQFDPDIVKVFIKVLEKESAIRSL
ncbi:HD domain-containing phosphohydrolase [Candidatus Latescibacterota bacterium]